MLNAKMRYVKISSLFLLFNRKFFFVKLAHKQTSLHTHAHAGTHAHTTTHTHTQNQAHKQTNKQINKH